MSSPFGTGYASAYDATYREKDYGGEVDLLQEAARRAGVELKSVLDIGCGTGGHALVLAERGCDVVGVDVSEAMLAIARSKAEEAGRSVEFVHADARSFDLGRRFDAVTFFFAVLGYQRTNADVRQALGTARAHLDAGGILFFDFWNGPGVVADPPGSGTRTIDTPDGPVTREASSEMDLRHHLATVRYRLTREGSEPVDEAHVMRFFFPMELELLLELEGFELLSVSPFGSLDGEAGAGDWTAVAVARAV